MRAGRAKAVEAVQPACVVASAVTQDCIIRQSLGHMREDRGQVIAGGRFSIGFERGAQSFPACFEAIRGYCGPYGNGAAETFCVRHQGNLRLEHPARFLGGREHMGEALVVAPGASSRW